jgi:hypothetical protein
MTELFDTVHTVLPTVDSRASLRVHGSSGHGSALSYLDIRTLLTVHPLASPPRPDDPQRSGLFSSPYPVRAKDFTSPVLFTLFSTRSILSGSSSGEGCLKSVLDWEIMGALLVVAG